MRRHWGRVLLLVTILCDGLLVEAGFLSAYWIRFSSGWIAVTKGYPAFASYGWSSLFAVAVWMFILRSFGLYRSRRTLSTGDEVYTLLRGVFVGTVVVMAATFLYRDISYSRAVLLLSALIISALLVPARVFYAYLYAQARRQGRAERVALVGSGRMAAGIRDRITRRPRSGQDVVGVILESSGAENLPAGAKVLGTIDEMDEIVRRENLDGLIVTLPLASHQRLKDLLLECEELHVDLRFVPDYFELMTSRVAVSDLEGVPLLGIRECPLDGWNRLWKRSFDLVVSSIGLLLLSPLLAVLAILIRLTSPGPAIYRQERVGRDGRAFTLYKFRSMVEDAEEESGPMWASADDPRRTPLGRFLRRTNLDELPQLVNVFKGEMSLVGPRPERPVFVNQFRGDIPRYFERHRVKSGITGWAQVNGLRGRTSIEERTRYDLFYVENWTLRFDIEIIVRTFLIMLFTPRNPVDPYVPLKGA